VGSAAFVGAGVVAAVVMGIAGAVAGGVAAYLWVRFMRKGRDN
jgi:hypothetical protein